MARTPRWHEEETIGGISKCKLSSWKYFSDFINQEMLDYTTYIYRGHGNSTWKLEPTLDRVIKSTTSNRRIEHLEAFKYATRGRRGPTPALLEDDNDWWALGQHHGLLTPLLDWTESPFVALYFAVSSAIKEKSKSYSVFAFARMGAELINEEIIDDDNIELINSRKPTVKIVKPLIDESSRLVSQRGVFTRGPNNVTLEAWIVKYIEKIESLQKMSVLMKITIPIKESNECLRYLNRMNINSATLFPDLGGASEFCNNYLTIKRY